MSSLNLNKVILCGRMTADPELKQTQSGIAVVSFTLAVNRRYQAKSADGAQAQQADFVNVVAWRQTAESICKYLDKGMAVNVIGELQTRTYTDKNGQNRKAVEVVIGSWEFGESKKNNDAPVVVEDDQDLPFD